MSKDNDTAAMAFEFDIHKAAEETIELLLQKAQEIEASKRMASIKAPANSNVPAQANDHPITRMIASIGNEPISSTEAASIYSLLAWVAYEQEVAQEIVQTVVESEFGVDHVNKIQRMNYDRAIKFLVDLRMDELN
jgi:hypothetical protein